MNKTDISFAATLAAIFAVTILAVSGLAHERQPQASADAGTVTLERVVVTATRRTAPSAQAVASAAGAAVDAAARGTASAHHSMPI